ncbi:MAG TPA: sugar phosphate isomerase/epimerase family protein [Chloroflexota bacterium]|jgi:sugar phosphate isomerase/epimerase|nr:sugar phosphate isomerase/epimerase family protein [Chloroflexota bacterium]
MQQWEAAVDLSISTCFDATIPLDAQLPLIAQAGFTYVSLSGNRDHFDYLAAEQRHHLRGLLRRVSLRLDTLHGPRLHQVTDETLVEVVHAAADLTVPIVVVHAGPFDLEGVDLAGHLERTLNTCSAIESVLRATGVRMALENVLPGPATELVRSALMQLDPAYFGFCYDSSHDQIDGPRPFNLLAELQDRVIAVHLSDRVRAFTDHVLPGEGFIAWDDLLCLLRTSPFAGPLLLEVMMAHSSYKDAPLFLQQAYQRGASKLNE